MINPTPRTSTQETSVPNYGRHAEVFLGDMPTYVVTAQSTQNTQILMRISLVRAFKSQLPITQIQQYKEYNQIKITPPVGWFMLFYQVFNAALVPCWLMGNLSCESFTRNSWRFAIVTACAYPFMLYEQRNLPKSNAAKWEIRQMLRNQLYVKVIYMRSMNYAVWVWCQVMASKYTSNNHAVNMVHQLTIMPFLLRVFGNKDIHHFEIGGSLLVFLGLFIILSDSLMLPFIQRPLPSQKYLGVNPFLRVIGDMIGLLGAFLRTYMSQQTPSIQTPPFTTFFLYNFFLTINFMSFGYFFGGSSLSFDPNTGVFGLFTIDNFVSIFYVSVFLGMGMLITNIFVTQIFSAYMIGFANVFEPIFSSCMYHITGIEPSPSGMTCLAYAFIVPGSLLILTGRGIKTGESDQIQLKIVAPYKD